MLGRKPDVEWNQWLKKTYTPNLNSVGYNSVRNHPSAKAFVLFVRLCHEEKSEMYTLRDLYDGMKIFEVKSDLELYLGIPASFMEIRSVHEKSFRDNDSLNLGKNVAFGDTIRVTLNDSWNTLMNAARWNSFIIFKRAVRAISNKCASTGSLSPNSETGKSGRFDAGDLSSKALFAVVRHGDMKLCKVLLSNDADTMYTTALGNTPLHIASHYGHLAVAQYLVANGSNIRCYNVRGTSPLDLASHRGHFELARWLWLNQWSVSLTKQVFSSKATEELPAKSGNTLRIPSPKRPISADVIMPTSLNSFESPSHGKLKYGRPKTASVYTGQLTMLDSKLPTRSSPTPTRSNTRGVSKQVSRRKVTINGLKLEKTRSILAYFASKKDRQRSIPWRTTHFDGKVTNTSNAWPKTSDRSYAPGGEIAITPTTERNTPTRTLNTSITQLNSPTVEITFNDLISERSGDDYPASHNNTDSTYGSITHLDTEQDSQHVPEITASLPKPFLMPFDGDNVKSNETEFPRTHTAPTVTTCNSLKSDSLKSRPSSATERDDSPEEYRKENHIIHLTIPRADQEIPSDADSIPSTPSRNEKMFENDSISNHSAAITRPRVTETSPGNAVAATAAVNSEQSPIEVRKQCSHTSIPVRKLLVQQQRDNTGLTRSETTKSNPSNTDSERTEDILKQIRKPQQPTQSNELLNSERSSSNITKDVMQRDTNSPKQVAKEQFGNHRNATLPTVRSPRSEKRYSFQNKNTDASKVATPRTQKSLTEIERTERNRKAFDAWLERKRRSDEKRKEENLRRKSQADSRRSVSSGLTFDEWLRAKNEETEEYKAIDAPPDSSRKSVKRDIRLHKTYEDWVKEKEEERRNQLNNQRILKEQTRIRMQQEEERKKKELERKRLEWLKKKEELRKSELEQKRKRESMSEEMASAEYQEWLSKPRVKTFDEWVQAKEQHNKMKQAAELAEKEAQEKREKEEEERRRRMAKEKFKRWLRKKEETKLLEAKKELERAREITLFLARKSVARPASKAKQRWYRAYETIKEETYEPDFEEIDDSDYEESSESSNDTEQEPAFKISVSIRRNPT